MPFESNFNVIPLQLLILIKKYCWVWGFLLVYLFTWYMYAFIRLTQYPTSNNTILHKICTTLWLVQLWRVCKFSWLLKVCGQKKHICYFQKVSERTHRIYTSWYFCSFLNNIKFTVWPCGTMYVSRGLYQRAIRAGLLNAQYQDRTFPIC